MKFQKKKEKKLKRMCKICSALMIGFLLIASCKLSGDPEIINAPQLMMEKT